MSDRRPRPQRTTKQPRRAREGRAGRSQRAAGGERTPMVHLSDESVAELKATARPGKGEILVKVFAEAATAFAQEDFDEAIKLGEQAKHIALRAAGPRELLGLAYYHSGLWKEAARELAAFRRITGSTEQNPVLADCYRAQGKPEKALEYIAEMDPGLPPAVLFEGAIVAAGALAEMDRVEEAIAGMEALELDPVAAEQHHLRAWYVHGDLLERRGRFTQAAAYFDAVANSDPELADAGARAAHLKRRG